ncbi:MAG TPA: hypothetical protein VFV05_08820 [Methylomirabilota bacterium]|nr:hypothetical protein [Methylomirabilota bacterium]
MFSPDWTDEPTRPIPRLTMAEMVSGDPDGRDTPIPDDEVTAPMCQRCWRALADCRCPRTEDDPQEG